MLIAGLPPDLRNPSAEASDLGNLSAGAAQTGVNAAWGLAHRLLRSADMYRSLLLVLCAGCGRSELPPDDAEIPWEEVSLRARLSHSGGFGGSTSLVELSGREVRAGDGKDWYAWPLDEDAFRALVRRAYSLRNEHHVRSLLQPDSVIVVASIELDVGSRSTRVQFQSDDGQDAPSAATAAFIRQLYEAVEARATALEGQSCNEGCLISVMRCVAQRCERCRWPDGRPMRC